MLPSTTPGPGGTPPTEPSASTGAAKTGTSGYTPGCATAGRIGWASRSQFAVVVACQIPFKLGCPSEVRVAGGAWVFACERGAWAVIGIAVKQNAAAIIIALMIKAVR